MNIVSTRLGLVPKSVARSRFVPLGTKSPGKSFEEASSVVLFSSVNGYRWEKVFRGLFC